MRELEFGPDSDEDLPEQVVGDIENGLPPAMAVRHWRGLSVDQVAEAAGITSADVEAVEDGALGDYVRLGKVAKALGVSVDLLLE
jgi:hypothetical protein